MVCVCVYSLLDGDVITLVSHWLDPKFEHTYHCQVTCKALYTEPPISL